MGIASKSSRWPGWLECYLAGLSVTAVVAPGIATAMTLSIAIGGGGKVVVLWFNRSGHRDQRGETAAVEVSTDVSLTLRRDLLGRSLTTLIAVSTSIKPRHPLAGARRVHILQTPPHKIRRYTLERAE